jgi:3',5'-cyclic AMP phosphodiesterase CpdA
MALPPFSRVRITGRSPSSACRARIAPIWPSAASARQLAALEAYPSWQERTLPHRAIHHPPVPGTVKPRASLVDGARFATAIARAGAELVLHGHMHRMSQRAIDTPRGAVPVIGVASASARAQHAHREQAQFHLYRVSREDGWHLELNPRWRI